MILSARQKIDNQVLSEALVYKGLSKIFPQVNDYWKSEAGYTEELGELRTFGIHTVKDLRILLKRHRRKILEIDRSPIDLYHQKMYAEEMGATVFNDFMRKRYWFAYPGLLRLALELEFKDKYEEFANVRDHI
ncbi:hypothetical protein [Undibacterium sp. Di24W]|uniref:hypothetical protein n=1 Tax=Undibacterium sp. Di24W TaxID=3413033 RepID=UPI003BF33722